MIDRAVVQQFRPGPRDRNLPRYQYAPHISELHSFAVVLLDDQDRLLLAVLKIVQHVVDQVDETRLEADGWLVDQEKLWIHLEGPRDLEQAPFAA